jgi:sterol 3beta-glucosyltransferase
LALGQELLRQGHRVRIATHEDFRSFVTENKLEFYNIGGDPKELMSYMVRSKHPVMGTWFYAFRLIGVTDPGLMPGFESLKNGDIGRKRKMLGEILSGCWDACTQSDPKDSRPFVADAIISNPPAFAHIHCAEALGIPLQMSFSEYS